jgi:PAS domain S-box-containing protein
VTDEAIASGVCRDLVEDGFVTVWVGLATGGQIARVAAAGVGVETLPEQVDDGPVADAVAAVEPRIVETAPAGVASDDESVGTVAVPFGEASNGNPEGVVVGYTPAPDDTDRRVVAAAARTLARHRAAHGAESRFRTAFARHDAPMLLFDPETDEIRDANDAAVDFYGYDELVGRSLPAITAGDDTAPVDRDEPDLGPAGHTRFEHELASGEHRTVEVHATPVEVGGESLSFAVIHDVTERVASEQSLTERTERMEVLNQLLRHDIRNDMAVIGATLDVLEGHVDETGLDHLDTLRERTDHVVELTHTARNITETLSVESGGHVETEPVRVDTVLTDAVSNAVSSFPHAEIRANGEPPSVTVAATELLESVFRNLLNNAVQHNDNPEPTVVVTATADDDTVTVRVADDGPGVPDRQKQQVFERGEKGSASDGTGLGLYLVGALVDSYDGEITVLDNDPRGAIFEVTLRRVAADDTFGGVA